MRTDKLFVSVGGALFAGFWIGFAAGLDNPPAQNDIQWETLLAGAVAIIGGWMAYQGAIAPFREAQKTKNLQFFMNMKNGNEDFWDYFVWEKDGYRVRDPLFVSVDSENNIDYTKNELKKPSRWQIAIVRYNLFHMYMSMPNIPSDILTKDIYKIRSDLREKLQHFLIETKVEKIPDDVLEDLYQDSLDYKENNTATENGYININEFPEGVAMSDEEFLEVKNYSQINQDFPLFEKLEKIAKILTRMRLYMLNNT